jgi:hypothetical protein
MNQPNIEILPPQEIEQIPQDFQLKIKTSFGELIQQADTLVMAAREIAAMPESQDQEKKARECRLSLVKVRTGADKVHKAIKADILVQSRAIDGAKNIIIAAVQPSEKELQEIENRAEIRAEQERQRLQAERIAALAPYSDAYNAMPLGSMSESEFEAILDNAKLAHEARIAREKREEDERIAAEKAAEQERIRLEQERIEKERIAAEERAELERRLAAEKAERERIEAEAKAERDRLEAEMKAQREKAEAIEREAKAERERLAKIEADRLAAEKAERERIEAEAKKAALAPDKEKIAEYAKALKAIEIPSATTEHGKAAFVEISKIIDRALSEIRTIYTTLK